MADNHYEFTQSGNPGSDLFEAIKDLGKAWDKFTKQRGILTTTQTNTNQRQSSCGGNSHG